VDRFVKTQARPQGISRLLRRYFGENEIYGISKQSAYNEDKENEEEETHAGLERPPAEWAEPSHF
jgi:hypothetical protein